MEQTMIWVILIVEILSICINIIVMVLLIGNQGKMRCSNREFIELLSSIQKQMETGMKQNKSSDEMLSELKAAVSGAVTNQMEHERKQMKQQMEEQQKRQEHEMKNTMVMPRFPKEKAGNILCPSCYKPYSVTEKKCPFCQARKNE